ncbi:MAG TPA: nucleotidyltransferase domain-containing protein [archaeon]|nr:nucleotidyltransferase domain-containing protein [archaeon]
MPIRRRLTPSEERLFLAKKFAKDLEKIYGSGLRAVFVCGSVAANLALPDSDIDMVTVVDNHSEANTKLVDELFKTKQYSSLPMGNFIIPTENFEAIRESPTPEECEKKPILKYWPRIKRLLEDGAVPVFGGKNYLKKFLGVSFNYPSRKKIMARLLELYRDPNRKNSSIKKLKLARKKGFPRF